MKLRHHAERLPAAEDAMLHKHVVVLAYPKRENVSPAQSEKRNPDLVERTFHNISEYGCLKIECANR